MNYPYPILRANPVDYKSSIFNVDIKKDTQKNGFNLKVAYEVNNNQIKELIDKHIL